MGYGRNDALNMLSNPRPQQIFIKNFFHCIVEQIEQKSASPDK